MKSRLFILAFITLLALTLPLIAQDTSPEEPVRATAEAMIVNGQATLDALNSLATQQAIEAETTPISESISVTTDFDSNPSELAFLSDHSGSYIVYRLTNIADLDSIEPLNSQLPISQQNGYDWGSFSYSPNGINLAFASDIVDGREIYIADLVENVIERITYNGVAEGSPSWSSDGGSILMLTGNSRYDIMQPTGNNQRWFRGIPGNASSIGWSPDGEKVVYVANGTAYIADMDGNTSALSNIPQASDIDWSMTNDTLVFASTEDGNTNLYTINVDGSELRQITSDPADEMMPSWSPDGTQIAYVSNADGNNNIYVIDVATGEISQMTNDPADDIHPTWRPDVVELAEEPVDDINLFVLQPNAGVTYSGANLTLSWESRELQSDERYSINIWTERQQPEYYSACAPFSGSRESREMQVNMFNLRWQWNGCPAIFSDNPTPPPSAERNFQIQIFIINVNNGRVVDQSEIIDFEWNTGS